MSELVTVNVHVFVFPAVSVAVHKMVVVPSLNEYPDVRTVSNVPQFSDARPTLSVALMGKTATWFVVPIVGVMTWFTGQLMVGLTESIVMVNGGHDAAESALVAASLTLHMTVIGVDGTLMVAPDGVEHAASAAPQVAAPVGAVYVTLTVVNPTAATRMFPGHDDAVSVGFATVYNEQ